MPITGRGWEVLIERNATQHRASGKARIRTVGTYQVFHDGVAVPGLAGMTAESKGPGSNDLKGVRIAPGSYPLATQNGGKYATIGYIRNANPAKLRRPGIELTGTGRRSEILIHPGIGFLASIGCINLCTSLPDAGEPISFAGSRLRVIAMIDDMTAFIGAGFPARDGLAIPGAHAVIEGEP
jgi:hypothetical protein